MKIVKKKILQGYFISILINYRQIDHLILCVHGIGQKLGERLEGVNFVHDVNLLRRTLKDTFSSSSDLNILLKESSQSSKNPNCRVQVLPVQWRQEIQFGVSKEYNQTEREIAEQDIGELSDEEGVIQDTGNATLKEITVEGLAPIRNLISDGTVVIFKTDISVVGYSIVLHS
jgi:hypothetical protein